MPPSVVGGKGIKNLKRMNCPYHPGKT